jgi:hypothetical protein
MTNQERREENQSKNGRRLLEDRRDLNEEKHNPDLRGNKKRRILADKRKSTS